MFFILISSNTVKLLLLLNQMKVILFIVKYVIRYIGRI